MTLFMHATALPVRLPPDRFFNRFTRADYGRMLRRQFEILEENVTLPNLGPRVLNGGSCP
jgi:hypothetical protein